MTTWRKWPSTQKQSTDSVQLDHQKFDTISEMA